jgi:hypothetical protein
LDVDLYLDLPEILGIDTVFIDLLFTAYLEFGVSRTGFALPDIVSTCTELESDSELALVAPDTRSFRTGVGHSRDRFPVLLSLGLEQKDLCSERAIKSASGTLAS